MEWLPDLRFGLLNGWITLVLLSLTDGFFFSIFPREVVKRLFDRSGWSQKQVTFTVLGKVCALGVIVLLTFIPLKVGSPVFFVGGSITILGLVGVASSLVTFRNTPLDEPVKRGLYRVSRHPQIVMASLVLLGGCVAIGSWAAVLTLLAARVLSHFGLLAEEEKCLAQYGSSYQEYLDEVPRYFIFF